MWDYDSFIAKAKLYFSRSETDARRPETYSPEATLWLLLGLEFFLRAPLARVHPTLLASPEGKSILHAAGFSRAGMNPRSISTKTVVDRLLHIEPNFGEDRGKDALFLADLRNGELHTADAVLQSVPVETWLPKFIDVVSALCSHLALPVSDFLDQDLVEHATAVKVKADRALLNSVKSLVQAAQAFFARLRADEIAARLAAKPADPSGSNRTRRTVDCPACEQKAADVWLSRGRYSKSEYDEDTGNIAYTVTYVVEELGCRVCDLKLGTTAMVVAAGVPRLVVTEYEESRYEGWETNVSYSEALQLLGVEEPDFDYGND